MSKSDLKVLIVSTEAAPYAKSGGLGDVIGSLPKELIKNGVDIRVVLPKYLSINDKFLHEVTFVDSFEVNLGWRKQMANILNMNTVVPTYLIENDYYFGRPGFYGYGDDYERFAFFSKASIEFLTVIDFKPDIIHFNDWQSALGPVYLRDIFKQYVFFSEMKSLLTIHNLQYQGIFARSLLGDIGLNDGYFCGGQFEFNGSISFLKAGLLYADAISTVSDTYAKEIQTGTYGYGLDGVLRERSNVLKGILNGIDYDINNPETDPRLFKNFNIGSIEGKAENKAKLQEMLGLPIRADVPVFSIISRLADQKGLDLIANSIDEFMQKDIQLIVLGTGEWRYEQLFKGLASRYPGKVSANICFDEKLAQKIYASSDIFLMPSFFEPCGLGQIIAMRYGTVPLVRKTGGLADTVNHFDEKTKEGNGFVFEDYLSSGLMWAVDEAIKTYHGKYWSKIVKNAMNSDFSWDTSAQKYIELYNAIK